MIVVAYISQLYRVHIRYEGTGYVQKNLYYYMKGWLKLIYPFRKYCDNLI